MPIIQDTINLMSAHSVVLLRTVPDPWSLDFAAFCFLDYDYLTAICMFKIGSKSRLLGWRYHDRGDSRCSERNGWRSRRVIESIRQSFLSRTILKRHRLMWRSIWSWDHDLDQNDYWTWDIIFIITGRLSFVNTFMKWLFIWSKSSPIIHDVSCRLNVHDTIFRLCISQFQIFWSDLLSL